MGTVLVAAIAAAGAAIVALINGIMQRGKVRAEAGAISVDTLNEVVGSLRTEMQRQASEIAVLRAEVGELQTGLATVRHRESLLVRYVRRLLSALDAAGIDHPTPPAGLTLDLTLKEH